MKTWLPIAIAVSLAAPASDGAAEPRSGRDAASIARLIDDLDHRDYDVRRRAMQRLAAQGRRAVGPLTRAASATSLEARRRAVLALEAIYTAPRSDEATLIAVEEALEGLAKSPNGQLAALSQEVLERNADIRERRALAEIERLGGEVHHYDTSGRTLVQPNAGAAAQGAGSGSTVKMIVLGRGWKGGDAGLKYVKRVPQLTTLYISRGNDVSPVSEKALKELEAAMPQLNIQFRGLAYLGISGVSTQDGCYISDVVQGAAADRAGVERFDVITGFAGKDVDSFETLISLIKQKQPGEQVPIEVLRRGRRVKLQATLDEWTR